MTVELVQQALKNAIYNEGLNTTLILHSDQGSQYTADAYEQLCKSMKVLNLSYSGKGCPYDNAPMESFNSIIKKELINHVVYRDKSLLTAVNVACLTSMLKRLNASLNLKSRCCFKTNSCQILHFN